MNRGSIWQHTFSKQEYKFLGLATMVANVSAFPLIDNTALMYYSIQGRFYVGPPEEIGKPSKICILQADRPVPRDLDQYMALYKNVVTSAKFVQPMLEFHDGRFTCISTGTGDPND